MTTEQKKLLEDDFKELDRILDVARIPQDWENADFLHSYLIRKIERLSFSKTPYETSVYEKQVLAKYKTKKQAKEEEQQQAKRERRAKISPLFEVPFIASFIAFQIWYTFQYTQNIELTLLYTSAWFLSLYFLVSLILLTNIPDWVDGLPSPANSFIKFFIIFGTPTPNIFLTYSYTKNIWISLLQYAAWLIAYYTLGGFKINRDSRQESETKSLLILTPIVTALCFLLYYFRPA